MPCKHTEQRQHLKCTSLGGWIRENKKTTICNLVVSGRRGTGEAAVMWWSAGV